MSLNVIEQTIRAEARNRLTLKINELAEPVVTAINNNTYDITFKDVNGLDVTVSNLTAITAIISAEIERRAPDAELKAINNFIRKVNAMG